MPCRLPDFLDLFVMILTRDQDGSYGEALSKLGRFTMYHGSKSQRLRKLGGLGIRTMREANTAFLTKLGRRLLTEKDKLWSQVPRANYYKNRYDVDMFEPKADASNTWH